MKICSSNSFPGDSGTTANAFSHRTGIANEDYYQIDDPHEHSEHAYRILRRLIEKKIIKEPEGYKKLCELIDEIESCI